MVSAPLHRIDTFEAVMHSRALRSACALAVLVVLTTGCGTSSGPRNPDYDPAKPHHRPGGFANLHASAPKPSFLKWSWQRLRDGQPEPPRSPIRGIEADRSFILGNRHHTAVTWVGQSTLLLQLDGLNLLTDPHWGARASPVRFAGPTRHQPPGIAFDDLPRIDAVLISHNHYDHLDLHTVRRLIARHPRIRFFVPLGLQYWFRDKVRGAIIAGDHPNVTALDWGDAIQLQGRSAPLTLHFLAVHHWSARSLGDRNRTLWGSWAVMHPRFRFWFSGDLAYSADIRAIGAQLGGFDLAAIAIGAYEPRWFMRDSHLNPAEAVQAMIDVHASSALAIHWGTFERMSDEPLDQPPKDLQAALERSPRPLDFRVLRHGQTWKFD